MNTKPIAITHATMAAALKDLKSGKAASVSWDSGEGFRSVAHMAPWNQPIIQLFNPDGSRCA